MTIERIPTKVIEFANKHNYKDIEECASIRFNINNILYSAYCAIKKEDEAIILMNDKEVRFATKEEVKNYFSELIYL